MDAGGAQPLDAEMVEAGTGAAAAAATVAAGAVPGGVMDNIHATLTHGGRFIQHNIFGNVFEVTAKYNQTTTKYKPPILAHHLHNQTTTTGNACVVACGATATKDHLFKGSQDQPGLVTIAMEEILQFAASIDGAVRVSSYQVVQDTHVFDLLEPKEQEVLVLEDAQGKTRLKDLSKVHVKTIEDFTRLGCFDENQDKQQPTKASSTQQQLTKPFSTQPQPTKASTSVHLNKI